MRSVTTSAGAAAIRIRYQFAAGWKFARLAPRDEAVRAIGDEVADWAASTTHWFPAGVAGYNLYLDLSHKRSRRDDAEAIS